MYEGHFLTSDQLAGWPAGRLACPILHTVRQIAVLFLKKNKFPVYLILSRTETGQIRKKTDCLKQEPSGFLSVSIRISSVSLQLFIRFIPDFYSFYSRFLPVLFRIKSGTGNFVEKRGKFKW